jgi:hypothetical protein
LNCSNHGCSGITALYSDQTLLRLRLQAAQQLMWMPAVSNSYKSNPLRAACAENVNTVSKAVDTCLEGIMLLITYHQLVI